MLGLGRGVMELLALFHPTATQKFGTNKNGALALIVIHLKVGTLFYAGAIILDTACFSQAADRTTDLDLRMAAEMEARGVDSEGREKLFEELLAARCDVSHLTPSQLLVKDMKIASGVPVPGLPILVEVCFGWSIKEHNVVCFIAYLVMVFHMNNCIFCMYSSYY